jgi:hypothetical protein
VWKWPTCPTALCRPGLQAADQPGANGHRSRVVRVHHRAACRRVRLLTEGTERPPPAPPGWGRSPSSWTDHPGQVAGPVDTGGRESRRRTTAARRDSRQPPSVARRELRRSSACTSRFSRPADLRVDGEIKIPIAGKPLVRGHIFLDHRQSTNRTSRADDAAKSDSIVPAQRGCPVSADRSSTAPRWIRCLSWTCAPTRGR